jgi:hypothetical protein
MGLEDRLFSFCTCKTEIRFSRFISKASNRMEWRDFRANNARKQEAVLTCSELSRRPRGFRSDHASSEDARGEVDARRIEDDEDEADQNVASLAFK